MARTAAQKAARSCRWFPTLVLGAAVVALLLRWPLLDRPLDRDEGLYAYMAQRMRRGEVPYRDVFSDKPPLGFLLYRWFSACFGETVRGLHLGGALWAAAGTALVAWAGVRVGLSHFAALVAAYAYAVHQAEFTLQGSSVNLELLLTPFALGAVGLAGRAGYGNAAAAGALIALAGLTKQQAVGHGAFSALFLLGAFTPAQHSWSERGKRLVIFLGGGLLVASGVVAWLAFQGALADFCEQTLSYNLQAYVRREPFARAPANLWRTLLPILMHNPLLYALAVVGAVRGACRSARVILLIWLLCCFAAVSIGFRYYPHYFQLTAPVICMLAGLGAEALTIRQVNCRPLVMLLLIAIPVLVQKDYFWSWTPRDHVRRLYGPELFHVSAGIAEALARWTKPGEEVFVFGSEPQIYFLARRKCATRYAFVHPLTVARPGASQLQRAVARQLQRRRPKAIVVVFVDMSYMYEPGADDYLERAVGRLCREHYWPRAIVYEHRVRTLPSGFVLSRRMLQAALAVLYVRRQVEPLVEGRRRCVPRPDRIEPRAPGKAHSSVIRYGGTTDGRPAHGDGAHGRTAAVCVGICHRSRQPVCLPE